MSKLSRWIESGKRLAECRISKKRAEKLRIKKQTEAQEKKPEQDKQRVRAELTKYIPDIQYFFVELQKAGYIDESESFNPTFFYNEILINYNSVVRRPAECLPYQDIDYVPFGMGISLGEMGEIFIILRDWHEVSMIAFSNSHFLSSVANNRRAVRKGLKSFFSSLITQIEVDRAK